MQFKQLSLLTLLALSGLNAQAASILATDTYNGHTYKLISAGSWTASEAYAQTLGGHLVTVNDQAENNWIVSQAFGGWGTSNALWIGYARSQSNPRQFVWADGSNSTYTNWAPGEPNNSNSYNADAENYVHTYFFSGFYLGKWNDLSNNDPYQGTKFGVVELSSPAVSSVPVPAAAWLFGSALCGFMGLSRRKQA